MSYNFKTHLENNMILTGGHFSLSKDGKSLNEGTINSFQHCVKLYAENKTAFKNLGIGLLINDIGTVCSASSCQTTSIPKKENFSFPDVYLSVLKEYHVTLDEIIIFWEKHIRNRAKKLLQAQLSRQNKSIIYKEKEGYVYLCPQSDVEILLTRYNEKDHKGTPACPLIMSAYSSEHKRLGYNSSLNFYYVGQDNYMNVENYFVIEKGRFLVSLFDAKKESVKNVYLFKDKMLKNF